VGYKVDHEVPRDCHFLRRVLFPIRQMWAQQVAAVPVSVTGCVTLNAARCHKPPAVLLRKLPSKYRYYSTTGCQYNDIE
jgi:hypothetical protein